MWTWTKNPDKVEPLNINGSEVEIVDSFNFLGMQMSIDLKGLLIYRVLMPLR